MRWYTCLLPVYLSTNTATGNCSLFKNIESWDVHYIPINWLYGFLVYRISILFNCQLQNKPYFLYSIVLRKHSNYHYYFDWHWNANLQAYGILRYYFSNSFIFPIFILVTFSPGLFHGISDCLLVLEYSIVPSYLSFFTIIAPFSFHVFFHLPKTLLFFFLLLFSCCCSRTFLANLPPSYVSHKLLILLTMRGRLLLVCLRAMWTSITI